MKTVYFYIYFHLYILVSKFNKRNAREGAIVYFSLIILFSSWPFVVVTLKNILNVPSTVFIIVMVIYMSLIFYTNKKYIQKLHRLKEIYQRFKNAQYALSVNGGNDKASHALSLGYDNNLPSAVENKFSRITLNNVNVFKPLSKLEIIAGINYVQSNTTTDNR